MSTKFKIAISAAAMCFVVLHRFFPQASIDGLTLALLVIAALPWLRQFVKSIEIPGLKVELQDVKEATAKVVTGSASMELGGVAAQGATGSVQPSDVKERLEKVAAATSKIKIERFQVAERLEEVAANDHNLALVGAGIEIEKRLRQLAEELGLSTEGRSLGQLLRELERVRALPSEALAGLRDIAALRNRAAHGASVSSEAAAWVLNMLPDVLATIDRGRGAGGGGGGRDAGGH